LEKIRWTRQWIPAPEKQPFFPAEGRFLQEQPFQEGNVPEIKKIKPQPSRPIPTRQKAIFYRVDRPCP
jgi:hypothetical protein